MPIPAVGRIVHLTSRATDNPVCRAAIITEVGPYPPGTAEAEKENTPVPVDLTVFLPDAQFTMHAMQDEVDHVGGTWHWPERV
jgi:hypothetical protein